MNLSENQLTMPADGGSGGRGIECTNGLNTNDCSALRSLEASPTLATGLESPPLKKGGIGNVPVVGDGSDCASEYEKTDARL